MRLLSLLSLFCTLCNGERHVYMVVRHVRDCAPRRIGTDTDGYRISRGERRLFGIVRERNFTGRAVYVDILVGNGRSGLRVDDME